MAGERIRERPGRDGGAQRRRAGGRPRDPRLGYLRGPRGPLVVRCLGDERGDHGGLRADVGTGVRTVGGDISGSGVLEKRFVGTLHLTGSNSYASTSITGGVVRVDAEQNLGSGDVALVLDMQGLMAAALQAQQAVRHAQTTPRFALSE